MKTPEMILNYINPKFLQKADRYLLLNYPRIWQTKIHYIFYYGILANVILNLLTFLFIKPYQIDEFIRVIILFIMIFEGGLCIGWFWLQFLFSVEKEYGNTTYYSRFLDIIIYTACTLTIISCSLTMTATAIYKVAYFDQPIINENTDCGSPYNELGLRYSDKSGIQYEKIGITDYRDIPLLKEGKYQEVLRNNKKIIELKRKWEEKFDINKKNLPLLLLLSGENNTIINDDYLSTIFSKYGSIDRNYFRGDICFDVKAFINNENKASYELPYDYYFYFHTGFAILVVSFLIILKFGNEDSMLMSTYYIFVLYIISLFSTVFDRYSKYPIHLNLINYKNSEIILIFIIFLFAVLLFNHLSNKKYEKLLYINFAALCLTVIFNTIIRTFGLENFTIKEATFLLIKLFPIYLCLLFIPQCMLIHILPLPKK